MIETATPVAVRKPPFTQLVRALLLVAVCIPWLNCGPGESGTDQAGIRHQRLFDAEAQAGPAPAISYAPVATLFDAGEDWLDSFALRRVGHRYSFTDGAFEFEPSADKPQLVLPVPADLTGVQAFEIVLKVPKTVRFQLLYTANPPRYDLVAPGRLRGEPAGDGHSRVIFDLRRAGVSSQEVGYLQLRFKPRRGKSGTVSLRSIRALRYADEYLEELAATKPEVTLDDDTRPARVVPVPSSHEVEVQLPSDPFLSASFGVPAPYQELTGEVEATITVMDGATATEVYSASLSPATNSRHRVWREILVPLSDWSSRQVTLVFEVRQVDGGRGDGTPGFAAWSSPTVFQADRRTPSVVVFLEDTLRADKIHAYGYPKPISPERDEFFHKATVFRRAYSASSWTLPAHASLFTSLRPSEHGVDTSSYSLSREAITLAETFRLAGYATMAITDDGYVSPQFGLNRGFDRFQEFKLSLATIDRRVARLEEFLDSVGPRPFFLFFHHYQTHEWKKVYSQFTSNPHDSDDPIRDRFPDELFQENFYSSSAYLDRSHEERREFCNALYDAAVAASDRIFGRVMDLLDHKTAGRRQIQVMLSDHGEMLEDHPGKVGHGRYHYEPLIRIPLMIRLTWEDEHRVVDEPVQITDVLPTLLDLARLEPLTEVKGRSLAPTVVGGETPSATREILVETNKHKAKITSLIKKDYKYNYATHPVPLKRALDRQGRRAGQEELSELGEGWSEEVRRAEDAAAAPFRKAIFGYYQSIDGLVVVRVANRTGTPTTVEGRFEVAEPLRDPYVSHGLIRDWRLEQGDVLATEDDSREVRFRLDLDAGDVDYLLVLHPEEDVRLHLADQEGVTLPPRAISIGPGGDAPSSLPISLASYDDRAIKSAEEPPETEGLSVRIWKTVGLVPFSVDPSQLDDERVERLKALGYLQ